MEASVLPICKALFIFGYFICATVFKWKYMHLVPKDIWRLFWRVDVEQLTPNHVRRWGAGGVQWLLWSSFTSKFRWTFRSKRIPVMPGHWPSRWDSWHIGVFCHPTKIKCQWCGWSYGPSMGYLNFSLRLCFLRNSVHQFLCIAFLWPPQKYGEMYIFWSTKIFVIHATWLIIIIRIKQIILSYASTFCIDVCVNYQQFVVFFVNSANWNVRLLCSSFEQACYFIFSTC